MTFRTRLGVAVAFAALLPILVFGFGVRRAMTARFAEQAERRIAALVAVLADRLADERETSRAVLGRLAGDLGQDTRFRLALVPGSDRTWLLDWAPSVIASTGFAALVVRDDAGRILSAGQFRNDFDRVVPVPAVPPDSAVVGWFRTPQGGRLARVVTVPFAVGERRFTLTGGPAFDSAAVARLAPVGDMAVVLSTDPFPAAPAAPDDVVESLALPYVAAEGEPVTMARLHVRYDRTAQRELARTIDRWFLAAIGVTLAATIGLALWVAGVVSRPIAELAEKTERLDLERLDQQFGSDRDDEIGALSRLLDAMTRRLRAGAARLREAERRATVGDLARQVNHDVKNGLAPIRHVVRHLGQVAAAEPGRLAPVFLERRETLESSIEYLDQLARSYARLSPHVAAGATELGPLMEHLVRQVGDPRVTMVLQLDPSVSSVQGDEVVLRRILENLIANAVDALGEGPGTVTLATSPASGDPSRVRITVTDTGQGMTREQLERAFDDFYTTKAAGTGLGLSVVRRLVGDLGGSIRAETAPGQGARFILDLPAR